MKTPKWAQNLILDAMIYLEGKGHQADLPDIKWRHATQRRKSSGVCHPNHITIVQGWKRVDCKLLILHELAHWVLPYKSGHEGHTPRFWDLAWELYRWAKLPVRYCLKREREYRVGAIAAYHRSK